MSASHHDDGYIRSSYATIDEGGSKESEPTIQTNRMRAIIAVNLQCILQFAFLSLAKVSVNKQGVNAFDIVYFANLISIVGSSIYACITGRGFFVESELRSRLVTRSVIGLIGLIAFTVGAALVPLSVQLAVGNMAPFFASVMGYLIVSEQMTTFEIVAMALSFGGVILIALGQRTDPAEDEAEAEGDATFGMSPRVAGIIGISMCVTLSLANGVLAILTRMMQSIHVSVMMSYIALVSLAILTTYFLIEMAVKGGPLRILSYTVEQYLYGFAAGAVNILGLICKIVAYQNERSGLITLLAYIGLVYGILGDMFLFDESFGALEIVGMAVILILNFSLICRKMDAAQQKEQGQSQIEENETKTD